MTKYYRLDIDYASMDCGLADESETDTTNLFRGVYIPENETQTLRFRLEIDEEDEDLEEEGEPNAQNANERLLFSYFPSLSVIERRLVNTIQEAGGDNLQIYPAPIEDPRTGTIRNDYVAMNVVGVVACADTEASITSPLADSNYFHNLVIDPSKAMDLLMFRLAESLSVVVIHEKIASAVKIEDYYGLKLLPLEETSS